MYINPSFNPQFGSPISFYEIEISSVKLKLHDENMYSLLTTETEREIVDISFSNSINNVIPSYIPKGTQSCLFLQFIRDLD